MIKILLLYCSALFVGIGHFLSNPSSWYQVELFGRMGKKQTLLQGEVSFLTWIFHWSMIVDFFVLLRYMWRWGDADCTNNCKWKLYAQLHVFACIINGIVVINHLHRDRLVALKVLHPVLVFTSSVATLIGSYTIVKENGLGMFTDEKNSYDNKRKSRLTSILIADKGDRRSKKEDWDIIYTLKSISVGAAIAFISTRFTV